MGKKYIPKNRKKLPEKELNKIEGNNPPYIEFKTLVIKMLNDHTTGDKDAQ